MGVTAVIFVALGQADVLPMLPAHMYSGTTKLHPPGNPVLQFPAGNLMKHRRDDAASWSTSPSAWWASGGGLGYVNGGHAT